MSSSLIGERKLRVTNERIVEEAWNIVNESFLGTGCRWWLPEAWPIYLSLSMQKRKDIPSTLILTRSKAHEWINVCLWIFSKFLPFLVGLYSFSELSPDSGTFSWVGYFLRI